MKSACGRCQRLEALCALLEQHCVEFAKEREAIVKSNDDSELPQLVLAMEESTRFLKICHDQLAVHGATHQVPAASS
jgi:hypothetical protein